MARLRLRRDVGVRVEFADNTPFGSPIGQRPEASIRQLFPAVVDHFRSEGLQSLVEAGPRLLGQAVADSAFESAVERNGSQWRVRPEVLYPDPAAARAQRLVFYQSHGGAFVRANVPADHWPPARRLVAALAGDGCDPGAPDLPEPFARLLGGLEQAGLVTPADAQSSAADRHSDLARAPLTFCGHNTAVVRSPRAAVVVDPLLFPHSPANPPSYQPLQAADLGPVDAVLVTHSHPDHFDPGSLLQFPLHTRIVVPAVERETVLAVAMARRLQELGFEHVTPLAWGDRLSFADIDIEALPFYGEQPTDGEVLHPEVRNHGNTYVVRTPAMAAAFLADSGRDHSGDVKHLAEKSHRERGPVDVVFSGYRGWITYPVQLVPSSVGRYILFVPPWLWGARQRLMNDAHDAVDVAERWGARLLVPYADGGAPWHWRAGLGPRLDGSGVENPGFDPMPERLAEAAAQRVVGPDGSNSASAVEVRLLRPGDSLLDLHGGPPLRVDGHAWAYEESVPG